MDVLVGAQMRKEGVINPDDHMAEGNGLEAEKAGQQRENSRESAAGNLNNPVNHAASGPQAKSGTRQKKPHGACGSRP